MAKIQGNTQHCATHRCQDTPKKMLQFWNGFGRFPTQITHLNPQWWSTGNEKKKGSPPKNGLNCPQLRLQIMRNHPDIKDYASGGFLCSFCMLQLGLLQTQSRNNTKQVTRYEKIEPSTTPVSFVCRDCVWGTMERLGVQCPTCGGQKYRHRTIDIMPLLGMGCRGMDFVVLGMYRMDIGWFQSSS